MNSQRCVIVTGGHRGMGAAISRAFIAAGYRVAMVGRNDSGLASELGVAARFWSVDVRDVARFDQLCSAVVEWAGRIDVLVNNAGASGWRALESIDEEFWQTMLDTNLKSVLFCTQKVVPHLSAGGVIINISSLAGKRGSANNSVYCAAKFGVNGLTQALAKELGPRGIRVNAVCPVYVETEGLREALTERDAPSGGSDVDAYFRSFESSNSALRRLPSAKEVASTCVFLASESASAITGQCLNVDCGVMPQ